jgi:hypothetical protein
MTDSSTDQGRSAELPASITFDLEKSSFTPSPALPAGTVVLLLDAARDPSWAADAAVELASTWAAQGTRIVLADLHLESPTLHSGLDLPNMEGVVDVFLYGASLARIARPVRDGAFYLITAGTYTSDVGEIYRHPRWRKLVTGFRDTEAALLLFAPADSSDLPALGEWSSEAIVLGAPVGPALAERMRAIGVQVVATIGGGDSGTVPATPRPAPGGPAAEAPPSRISPEAPIGAGDSPAVQVTASAAPQAAKPNVEPPIAAVKPAATTLGHRPVDHGLELPPPPVRRRPERSGLSLVLWLLLAVIVVGTIAYLVATRRPDLLPDDRSETSEQEAAALSAAAPNRLGEMLPYSVQVRAFTSLEAANAELANESERLNSATFFISPEEIQGVRYYRILAGLSPDTLDATRLRDRLIEIGVIEQEEAPVSWSLLQFTPLAFDLGEFSNRVEADLRADSLLAQQIPTYPVLVPYSDGSNRWQLYAGAYRDSASAETMRTLLESAGLAARLTPRTGVPEAPAE